MKGFQNCKDATHLFCNGEQSKCHTKAVEKVVKLPVITSDVGMLLVSQLAEEKKCNREMLLHILQSILFSARQGLPLHGVTYFI